MAGEVFFREYPKYIEGIIELHNCHYATRSEMIQSKEHLWILKLEREHLYSKAVPDGYHFNQLIKLSVTSSLTI